MHVFQEKSILIIKPQMQRFCEVGAYLACLRNRGLAYSRHSGIIKMEWARGKQQQVGVRWGMFSSGELELTGTS